jgi:hypothetical protein
MINRHNSENFLFSKNNYIPYNEEELAKVIPRWDKLYQLDKKKREILKLKKQQNQEEKEYKELEECTFKPIINNNTEYINKNYYSNKTDSNREKVSKFYSRQELWDRKKKEKLKGLTKGEEKKELIECKFVPKIVK